MSNMSKGEDYKKLWAQDRDEYLVPLCVYCERNKRNGITTCGDGVMAAVNCHRCPGPDLEDKDFACRGCVGTPRLVLAECDGFKKIEGEYTVEWVEDDTRTYIPICAPCERVDCPDGKVGYDADESMTKISCSGFVYESWREDRSIDEEFSSENSSDWDEDIPF
jgi:hypothetical protein